MAKQSIGVGATPNDGTGDPLRNAMIKINENFTELYNEQFDGAYTSLTGKPTSLLYWVNDGSEGQVLTTNGSGTITFEDPTATVPYQINLFEQTFGRVNGTGDFVPLVIRESVDDMMSDVNPPDNVVNGLIVRKIYSKRLSRYTAGGELFLTFTANGGDPAYYTTKKFMFSRVEADPDSSSDYNVVETGTSGATELYDSIRVIERRDGVDTFLEVEVSSPNSGLGFIRVIGEITYTSVPLSLTVSGY